MTMCDQPPETLRSCECATLRHLVRIAKKLAVEAKALTLQVEPIVNDMRDFSADGGYQLSEKDKALDDAFSRCIAELSRFGAACVVVDTAKGIE
jgi:hypothetical protein